MKDKSYKIRRVDEVRWEIPKVGSMRVPGLIYSDKQLFPDITKDNSCDQVYNVAHLPGIVAKSIALPDIHWGYGFPIGGVAAFDLDEGVVSPGGVGYDINCGVRLATTAISRADIKLKVKDLVDSLYSNIPSGLGSKGTIRLTQKELSDVAKLGARWAIKQGMGDESDLERIEDGGIIAGGGSALISDRSFERGKDQLGTLGAGNHFIEIGFVEKIFDEKIAKLWGIVIEQVTLMIHTGSRGFGYQICDEFLAKMIKSVAKEKIDLPDRQLACTRLKTPLAREYLYAMAAAANFAFANRQILMKLAQDTWLKSMRLSPRELKLQLLYDVSHNIAKIETHDVNGKSVKLCVHRKGATRALPPGHPLLPSFFINTGQPVLIPGDMGRCSFILVGAQGAMEQTFGSTCHGAGRVLSRNEALRKTKGRSIEQELERRNVYVRASGRNTMREEMPDAYKDVSAVVNVVNKAGLARTVARIKPLGVVKG
ncbi:MAG: RtcB family protein [Desulfomonilaceae bacterium]